MCFWFIAWSAFLMQIRKIKKNVLWIHRRFYWCTGHWILIRFAIVQCSINIVRYIQMSYFLMLVMIRKSQITTALTTLLSIFVLRLFCLWAIDWINQNEQGWFSTPYIMSNHVFSDFQQYLSLDSVSHPAMLRMDAASLNWAALKGESGGVASIVVETQRFVDFLASP